MVRSDSIRFDPKRKRNEIRDPKGCVKQSGDGVRRRKGDEQQTTATTIGRMKGRKKRDGWMYERRRHHNQQQAKRHDAKAMRNAIVDAHNNHEWRRVWTHPARRKGRERDVCK